MDVRELQKRLHELNESKQIRDARDQQNHVEFLKTDLYEYGLTVVCDIATRKYAIAEI